LEIARVRLEEKNMTNEESRRLWKEGSIGIPDAKDKNKMTVAKYNAKVYDEPSNYGINGGKISKLQIRINGEVVCNYDRGWDEEPKTEEAKIALYILLENYN
jgi:hypothetical protein